MGMRRRPIIQLGLNDRWISQQREYFHEVWLGEENLALEALAGCGKSTTILEALNYTAKDEKSVLLAFNAAIRDELKRRAPKSTRVSTLNSYGLSALQRTMRGKATLDERKLARLLSEHFGDREVTRLMREGLEELIRFAKYYLVPIDEPENAWLMMDEVIDKHDLDIPASVRQEWVAHTIKILQLCKQQPTVVDFDDQIWIPLMLESPFHMYDRVFIDEAQDLNVMQMELVLRARRRDGLMNIVGDRHQAIYGWRGAHPQAMQQLTERVGAKRMPLPVTFRCGHAIVEVARKIVPEFQAWSGVPEGLVANCTEHAMLERVRPGDYILSRFNAPLVRHCYKLLSLNVPSNIAGRDVGVGLIRLINMSRAKTIAELMYWLQDYQDAEIARLTAKDPPRDIRGVQDRVACVEALSEGMASIAMLVSRIEGLFVDTDDHSRVLLSSTHKAKGKERDRVYMLRDTYMSRPGPEERNLYYVAVTRAKRELYMVYRDQPEDGE